MSSYTPPIRFGDWGARADDAEALDKLYALKGRKGAQPSLVLVDAEGLLEEYAHPVPEIAWDLLRESAPESRPMTLVLPGGTGCRSCPACRRWKPRHSGGQ